LKQVSSPKINETSAEFNKKPELVESEVLSQNHFMILLLKTSQFKTVCKEDSGYITQLKQKKNHKGDIT